MRRKRFVFAAAVAAVLAVAPDLPGLRAADHGDAPAVRFDTRLDINDVYAFQSPNQSGNVVFIVTVMNIGDADLANVTITGSDLGLFGCTTLAAPFPLPMGMAAKVQVCQGTATCPVTISNIFTVNAEASPNGGLCVYGTNGQPARVQTKCDALVTCLEQAACRVTGGGRQETTWPAVQFMTHGGQVGASR